MNSTTARRRKHERGNVMIEFAIASAVLIPLILGTFQFGYCMYQYNKLQTAVRAGARYASLRTYDSPNETVSDGYRTAVRNVVIYGSPAGGTTPVIPGLTADHVTVRATFESQTPSQVDVAITGFQIDAVIAKFTLPEKPIAKFRYMGRYAPV